MRGSAESPVPALKRYRGEAKANKSWSLCGLAGLAFFAALAGAQTNSPLGAHWGAADYPSFRRGFQAGLSVLSFTEYDSEGRRFGTAPGDSAVPYPETMGFNWYTLSYGNHLDARSAELSNMMYRYSASLGANSDRFTEFYQNQVIHKGYRDLRPVPRDAVRCSGYDGDCIEYAASGEVIYRFTNVDLRESPRFYASSFFAGVGASLGSVLQEGYVELGMAQLPTLIHFEGFGLRAAGLIRMGGILDAVPGSPRFRRLASGYELAQGGLEAILFERVYRIVLRNDFTYHSGLFLDTRSREIRQLFWTIGIDLDNFHFEAANDMLGGTDFGPSFGGRFYWDIDRPGRILQGLESFAQRLNR
jgi:hypothetical protein